MSNGKIALVDRDARTRPRSSWRDAWALSEGHALSTISLWTYARNTVACGGWRAVAAPIVAWVLLTAAFLAVAFGAAALAGAAAGSTRRAALILLASVALSQVVTAAQNRRLARRLFVVANVRVDDLPRGWAIAWLTVPAKSAPAVKRALFDGPFRHVETTY